MRGVLIKSTLILLLLIPIGYYSYMILLFFRYGDLPPNWGTPGKLVVDKQEYVYVIRNSTSSEIYKLNPNGKLVSTIKIPQSEPNDYARPIALALNQSKQLYFIINSNKGYSILGLNLETNQYIANWPVKSTNENSDYDFIGSLALDSDGNVYIATYYQTQIQKYNASGHLLARWGYPASQLFQIGGMAFDREGNTYLSDHQRHFVYKFDNTGRFLQKWGGEGQGAGQFNNPSGLAINQQGDLYIADSGNNRIQKFTSDGRFLAQWGHKGEGQGELKFPQEITNDSAGNIYVADTENYRIQKFDANGKIIWESSPYTWEEQSAFFNSIVLNIFNWLPKVFVSWLIILYGLLVWLLIKNSRAGRTGSAIKNHILAGNDYWYLLLLAIGLCLYSWGGVACISPPSPWHSELWIIILAWAIFICTGFVLVITVIETINKLEAKLRRKSNFR